MATLNTLRTKYGIVLSVIIALVLLAFILGDQLSYQQPDMEYQDPAVMVVDGQAVPASEYSQVRENVAYADHLRTDIYRMYAPEWATSMGEDAIAATAADILIYNKVLAPAFEALAIKVYQNEVDANITSESQTIARNLLSNGWNDNDAMNIIAADLAIPALTMESQLAMEKYINVATAGAYLNKLEVEERLREEGYSYNARYIELPLSSIAVADEAITEEEIAAYYEANRKENENYGNRTLAYVSIPRVASAQDRADAEERARAFAAAVELGTEDLDTEANKVSATYEEKICDAATLAEDVKAAFKTSNHTELALNNETWAMDILLEKISAPLTYDIEFAHVASLVEADALVEELVANGGDTAAVAEEFRTTSIDLTATDNAIADSIIGRGEGDVFNFRNGGSFTVVKVQSVGETKELARVAEFRKSVIPSDNTLAEISANVDELLANIGDNMDSFNNAIITAGYTPREGLVRRQNTSQRGVDGISNSRALAVWAYDANIGDKVRMIIGDNVYVAMVKSIDENQFQVRDDSAIKRELRADKQYAMAAAQLTSIDNVPANGELKECEVTATSADLDAKLVAAITKARETGRPVKVRGTDAAYLVVVDAINGDEITAEAIATERTPLTDEINTTMVERVMMASLVGGIDVEDLRDSSVL